MNTPATKPNRTTPAGRSGFTLIELLITVTVIAILAAVVLGALFSARQAAARANTNSMITRLNKIIMRRYEGYRTRRVPLDTRGFSRAKDVARARLDALRDLIRMEMPERRNDIANGPVHFEWDNDPNGRIWYQRPALSQLYFTQFPQNNPDDNWTGQYATAECLYLIVMTGPADDRAQFNENEIGDKDGDGWPEFKDGWGEPIYFLRWAPGFNASGVQQNIELTNNETNNLTAMALAAEQDHDPFDTRKLEPYAFRLVPLIYSAGADRKPGVNIRKNYVFGTTPLNSVPGDPYRIFDGDDPDGDPKVCVGSPVIDDGDVDTHYDNIHNHLKEQR